MAPIAVIAGIASIASGGLQAAGAITKGNAEADAANYNAQVAASNAGLATQQAAEDERIFRIQSRGQIAEQRAGYAASGVQSQEGNAVDVLGESASNAELDALKIRHGGEVKANAYQQEAYSATRRGELASLGGGLSAAGTLLGTTASSFGRKWTS